MVATTTVRTPMLPTVTEKRDGVLKIEAHTRGNPINGDPRMISTTAAKMLPGARIHPEIVSKYSKHKNLDESTMEQIVRCGSNMKIKYFKNI